MVILPADCLLPAFWVCRILSYTPSEFSSRVLLVWITWRETSIFDHICLYFFPHQQNWHPTIKPGAVAVWLLGVSIQEGLWKISCYYRHLSGCGCWIAFFKAKIRGETQAIRVFIKSRFFLSPRNRVLYSVANSILILGLKASLKRKGK